jgi:splicing factor U2AF subunit
MQFLNAAMRRIQLCQQQETPISTCRVNQKFAFIECTTSQMANKALNMNGIPFLGAILKISRPSKYAGNSSQIRYQTWQELTGQAIPTGSVLDASAEEKVNRELFIGNTTPEMTESMIREFLGNAMLQVGLNTMPGNPITACRVSGKFAFVELRTPAEAANALNLNNIPYLGAQLRVGRPSKWSGTDKPHGNWEDILAKYMSGELQMPNTNAAPQQAASVALQQQAPPSRIVELQNMLSVQDLQIETEYQEILEDTREECSQFGTLTSVIIPKANEAGATKIFLEYGSAGDAAKAIQSLAGRTFDGRQVIAMYYDEGKFARREF